MNTGKNIVMAKVRKTALASQCSFLKSAHIPTVFLEVGSSRVEKGGSSSDDSAEGDLGVVVAAATVSASG